MNSNFLLRLKILGIGLVCVMLLILAKLFFVQIIHHNDYISEADGQYTSRSDGVYNRGTIYFTKRDGTLVSGATLAIGYKLILVPNDLKNSEDTYKQLNAVVPIEYANFIKKAAKKNDPYEVLAEKIPETIATSIRALNLKGIHLEQQKWRFYPGDELAAKTIGFVAYKGDDLIGRYGLERSYNDVLSRSKDDLYVNFFAELFTNLHKELFRDAHAEGDVITTIEPVVQHTLEKTLNDYKEKWQVEQAGALVLDPATGDIIALAAIPDFNLNEFSSVTDVSHYGNPIVEDAFELGSIVKPLTLAAGIDAGVITPDTTYKDTGCTIINTEKICNFDGKARNITNMQTVLKESLNLGAAFVMQKLGRDRFRDYFTHYGITEKTSIDLPGEIKSITGNLHSTRDIEYVTASFGQGIALTPIAAAQAFTVLANKGVIVSPRVVKEISYPDGMTHTIDHPHGTQVIKPETAETITRMLVNDIDTGYGAGRHKLEHYSVAAKTGTAQIARTDGRGYEKDKVIHSIIGYYPAYNPRFLVLMYGYNPRGAAFSSETMVDPLMDFIKFTLTYYDVAPDR